MTIHSDLLLNGFVEYSRENFRKKIIALDSFDIVEAHINKEWRFYIRDNKKKEVKTCQV